jgi:GT2 family glycosyltransferase/ADP-heptose:LPS heptosyltransferase/predicted SAM-dependent methyltransferase
MNPRFSIIIPTVKATILVKQCIDSLIKHEPDRSKFEVVVVDDGSDSYVQEWLKTYCNENDVKLFLKEKNEGFSHTVNVGLRNARGEYLLLVNNDILFIKPCLDEFERAFDRDEKIAIVGAKLLYPNHTIQHAGVVRIPNSASFVHVNKHRNRDVPEVNKSQYFLAVTGALFGIRRKFFETSGGLNEGYFVACEDVEYCLRAWKTGSRVFYNHAIEAVHIEGETRGNTDATKLKKGPQWFLKEKETTARFFNDLKNMDVNLLESHVSQANQKIGEAPAVVATLKKLEIGCGYNPQPGYIHMDVRQLPHVEHICDFETSKLPFENNDLDEVLLNHVIEHISWRNLGFVFDEWFRALKPGGRVFLRTPDLEFIARTYLEGKTTPEWPGDEDYVKKHLADKITPAWWANIKLFAGQDYDSNYHYLCFDFEMLRALFEKKGFVRISRVNVTPVYSPGELQVEAFKPTEVENQKPKEIGKRILIKRRGALGDVILTTPIAKKLREDNGRSAVINVATDSGTAYMNNPYVDTVMPFNSPSAGYDQIVDLDLAYEKSPKMHIIDAYSMVAFGHTDYDKTTTMVASDADRDAIDALISEKGIDPSKLVLMHMAVTWKNRTWPKDYWSSTVDKLLAAGYQIGIVGSGGDMVVQKPGVVDLTKRLTLHQIAELIGRSKCFVGSDSGLLHVAGTTETPIVGLFFSAKGEYRVPYRRGELGWRTKILKPSVECYGCLAMEKPPVVFCDCKRSDYICLSQITPDMVLQGVKDVVGN